MNFFLLSLPLGQSFYQDETKTISMADEGGIRNALSAHILMTFSSSAIVNRFSCSKDRFGSSEDRKIAVKGHCSTVSQWIMSFPTSEQVHRFILVRLQSLPLPLSPHSSQTEEQSTYASRTEKKPLSKYESGSCLLLFGRLCSFSSNEHREFDVVVVVDDYIDNPLAHACSNVIGFFAVSDTIRSGSLLFSLSVGRSVGVFVAVSRDINRK